MGASFSRFVAFALAVASLATSRAFADCGEQEGLFRRGQELYEAGQYLLSATHFSVLANSRCLNGIAERALFSYSLDMAELGEIQEALRTLSTLARSLDSTSRQRARLLQAFLDPGLADALPEPDRRRLSLWSLRSLQLDFAQAVRVAPLSENQRSELLGINEELDRAPSKSLGLAGGASAMIPGAGQAYVGAYQSAAISLVLNAVFLASTVEFAQKGFVAPTIASGMVFSVTYLGNILNAIEAARKFNASHRAAPEAKLKILLFPEFKP